MLTLLIPMMLACSGKDSVDEPDGPDGPPTDVDSADPALADCLNVEPPAVGEPALVLTGERPVNLLFISIDTLNISRLSRYGGPADAPTLSAFLDEGLTLDNHFSCAPWTYPSMLCSMSGRSTIEIGFVPKVSYQVLPPPAPEEILFLADLLKAEGYGTGLVTANPYLGSYYTIGRGFETETISSGLPAGAVFDSARAMMTELLDDDKPWYGHVHLIDPHAPYEPPPEYYENYNDLVGDFPYDVSDPTDIVRMLADWGDLSVDDRVMGIDLVQAIYDGEIAHIDDQLTTFMDELDAAGALDNTLVVFFSDHGEQFMDHGDIGHGASLFNDELGSMTSFWMKDGGITPTAWTGPTDQRDLLPTLFDALGLPAQDTWSGRIVGTADPGRGLVSLRYRGDEGTQAIVRNGYKFVYDWQAGASYYDLTTDYEEKVNLHDRTDPTQACDWEALKAQSEAFLELYPEHAESAAGR